MLFDIKVSLLDYISKIRFLNSGFLITFTHVFVVGMKTLALSCDCSLQKTADFSVLGNDVSGFVF